MMGNGNAVIINREYQSWREGVTARLVDRSKIRDIVEFRLRPNDKQRVTGNGEDELSNEGVCCQTGWACFDA